LAVKPDKVPIACTLAVGDTGDRLGDWDRVLAAAVRRLALPTGGLRVEFDDTVDVAGLARLAAAEQECCAFFRFAVTVDHRGVALEVDAPSDAHDLIAGLFGTPT
jgi:hypothetical protein